MSVYISEIRYDGGAQNDFIEVAAKSGTDLSGYSIVIYDQSGAVTETYSLGSAVSTNAGKEVYLLNEDDPEFATLAPSNAVALVDDQGNVLQFVSFEGNTTTASAGPANGMASESIGNTSSQTKSLESTDRGASYTAIEGDNPGSVPCYAPGTMIAVPGGLRAVEDLRLNDLVETLDHGPQPVRWVRTGDHPLEEVELDAKPVLIAAGALGSGLPTQDLIVSPQHRILVGGGGQFQRQFKTEAFAPAKSLISLPGIRHMKGKTKITFVHFACARHEVVFANGCLSESLLLGPMVVNKLTAKERRVLTDIFGPAPSSDTALNGLPARACLRVGEVRRLLAEYSRQKRLSTKTEICKWDRDLATERHQKVRLHDARSPDRPREKVSRFG